MLTEPPQVMCRGSYALVPLTPRFTSGYNYLGDTTVIWPGPGVAGSNFTIVVQKRGV
jgi:hypothetical protein